MTIITLHHLCFGHCVCEFVGDCFGPRHVSSGAALPQKNTSVQNNHLRFHTMTSKKDGAQLLLSKYFILCRALIKVPDLLRAFNS